MTLIAGAMTSLKTASDIAKGLLGLRDGALIQGQVIELQAAILSAQTGALAAQSDQFTLVEQIRALEAEMARMKAWDAEKERYRLTEFGPSIFAYMLKSEMQNTEPLHAICANCYEHSKKSILQYTGHRYGRATFVCHECKSTLDAWINNPKWPFPEITYTPAPKPTVRSSPSWRT